MNGLIELQSTCTTTACTRHKHGWPVPGRVRSTSQSMLKQMDSHSEIYLSLSDENGSLFRFRFRLFFGRKKCSTYIFILQPKSKIHFWLAIHFNIKMNKIKLYYRKVKMGNKISDK